MDRRTAESPMDFEWQTRAPGDVTSPFYQLGLQRDNQKKSFVFDSPMKKPPSQSVNFSQPSPQRNESPTRPGAIFGKPAFQTPRKFDLDFSSGAENMSSPEYADNEDTPEPVQMKKKEKRNSLFAIYGRWAPSPGRGEIARVTKHTTDPARRVHKRRIRDRDIDRHLRRDSDYDSDRPSSREGKQPSKLDKKDKESTPSPTIPPPQGSTWAHFFAFLDEHPNLPAVLSYWLQLVWNLILFSLVTWVVVSFVLTIKQDIDHAADAKRNDILTEMSTCKEFYIQNSCNLASRPPALNDVCNNWERCMDQDPTRVARATVSVQTISAIITGFVDAISFKAFSYFLLTITTITIASNWSFIALRHQYTKKEDRYPFPNAQNPQGQPPYQHQQAPPLSYPANGSQYPLEYPKTPGRENSPSRRQRKYDRDEDNDDEQEPRRLLLENTPSRNMDYVTGRSRERELHSPFSTASRTVLPGSTSPDVAAMTATPSNDAALQGNYDVDYVIRYTFGGDRREAKEQLNSLLQTLAGVGFLTEVRPGDRSSLLIFIRAPHKSLLRATHTTRVRDWLYGLRNTQPNRDSSPGPQTDAERLRAIYYMLTAPTSDGGANITPKFGKWKNVDSLFPLHDDKTNQSWMRDWSKKTFLSSEDLDQIRDKFGEQVGFYFSFLQTYFRFLFFPALFGFSSWLMLGYYSPVYALVNCVWCVVFVEYWKRKEEDLALRWQVRGVSVLSSRNRSFKPESEVRDEATGELRPVFPWRRRLQRQMLQIPFAFVAVVALGAVIATCFAIEIFISEVYNGPLKSYLVFIPTVLLSSILPIASTILTRVAKRLTEFENYETKEDHDVAFIQKMLVINFITSYLAIFLTAFVYVPFAHVIVPYLDIFRATVRPFVSPEDEKTIHHSEFKIDPNRLRNQVIYFAVTAQIVNFFLETILPFILQRISSKYKKYSEEKANGHEKASAAYDDHPDEVEFLKKVREEADLPEYETTDDLRQMVIQFGYLSLFSTVWPLVPVSFLFNNWLELRSDFFKICKEFKRPVPERADTIGPWLDTLGLLAWVGSITSPALVYLARSQGLDSDDCTSSANIRGWMLMTTIFFSEHIYLGVRYAVEKTMTKIDMPSIAHERIQKILMRKEFLAEIPEESLTQGVDELEGADAAAGSQITRATLEEDARARTLHHASPSDPFWERQKNWREALQIGERIIESYQSVEAKKHD